jgi:hypothetical protein
MVVLIRIDALHRIVLLEVVLNEQLEYLHVDGDLRETYEYAPCYLLVRDLIEPGVLTDV